MARTRQKTKPGRRDKGGRLLRSAREVTPLDRGSDWVQIMRDKFGVHYNSAIGRAYAGGLLGDPADDARAADRLANAQRFAQVHRRVYGGDFYRCPLDDSPRGGRDVVADITDADRAAREWLAINVTRVDLGGCRAYLDQLICSLYVDTGPAWLDRLLEAPKGQRDPRDMMVLECAIKAIDAIGPVVVARVTMAPILVA